jgi:quaternary ammonium compound-resistance protein SugE
MIYWFYLFCASCLEVGWMYSLKYMNVKKIREIAWAKLFTDVNQFYTLFPLMGYIVFGIGNIVLFSMALKYIPASTAFVTWMAMTLIGGKMVDTLYFKETFTYTHLLYMAFILIGIIGLKKNDLIFSP